MFGKNVLKMTSSFIVFGLLTACSTIPKSNVNLSNYSNLNEAKGIVAKYQTYSNMDKLNAYKKIKIDPTIIKQDVLDKSGDARLDLVANLIDRELCLRLAQTYEILDSVDNETLSMKVFITEFEPTGKIASAISGAIPVPIRIPSGLGKLSAETEILTPNNEQALAFTWSQKADMIVSNGGMSKISDAYDFAGSFASQAGNLASPQDKKTKTADKDQIETNKQIVEMRQKICTDKYGKSQKTKGFISSLSPVGIPPESYDSGKNSNIENNPK